MGRAHARETHETKGGAAVDIFVVHDEVIAADLPAVTLSAPCEAAARVRERQRCAEPARRVNPAGAGLHARPAANSQPSDARCHWNCARNAASVTSGALAAAASFAMAGTASSSGVVAVCASAANASHSAADARASGDVAAAADAHTPGDTSLDVASGDLSLAGFWRGGFACNES